MKWYFFFLFFICTYAHAEWIYQTSGTTADLVDVCFVDELHGWAIGIEPFELDYKPVIIATDDGGVTWHSQVCPKEYVELTKIYFVNENTGYIASKSRREAVGFDSYIFSTTNGGGTWEISYSAPYYYRFKDISFIDENTGWVVGGIYELRGGVIVSTKNSGAIWNQLFMADPDGQKNRNDVFDAILFADSTHGWILGNDPFSLATPPTNIYQTTDAGEHWILYSKLTQPKIGYALNLHITSQNTLWTSGSTIASSYDNGLNWTVQTSGIIDYAPVSSTKGWAISMFGNPNNILFTDDGGISWTEQLNQNSLYFYAIEAVSESFVCAVGRSGSVIIYRNDVVYSDSPVQQEEFTIEQNYPNPFNPSTTITYALVNPGRVKLTVYSVTGQKVATLVDSPMTAGTHSAVFDGSNLSSGVYFYRFDSPGFAKTGKMLMVK